MAEFVQVSKEEFFNTIGQLDVTVTPVGDHPYRTDFKLRNGVLMGYEDRDGVFYRRENNA